jgi:hypothetical protein
VKFGFLIGAKTVNAAGILIEPLAEYPDILTEFYETARVSDGWVYGREFQRSKTAAEKERFKNSAPKATEPFFRLGSTHQVTSRDLDEDQLRFVILSYGFLNGLYLAPESYACLRKVPYREGKLTGVMLVGADYEIGLGKIRQFLSKHNKNGIDAMKAILHWFLVGQSYEFEWDRFDAQYKVLDGIFKLSGVPNTAHSRRPEELVKYWSRHGILLPSWAKIDNTGKSQLGRLRNALSHEAVYAEAPIGYAYPQENYDLEFVSLNVKLIAALFEIESPYLCSEPNDRSQWGWGIKP